MVMVVVVVVQLPPLVSSKYFEIPTIILSVFFSSFSVGSDPFLRQEMLSLVNCEISMVITILTSVKYICRLQKTRRMRASWQFNFRHYRLIFYKNIIAA
jgi:hypothetical protein